MAQRARDIDVLRKSVVLEDESRLPYGALLIATGADPIRLDVPGADAGHVHALRSLDDSRAIIAAAEGTQNAAVIGASFIGLEVAAALRMRDIAVHVVAPEPIPMERILGAELGRFVRRLHEEHGVQFHLQQTVARIDEGSVSLSDGSRLDADLVVVGIGVRPVTDIVERAGIRVDGGVMVDAYLRTSAPDVWAAGDIARWPDPHSGQQIRVEHWVVAQRQGQTAAPQHAGAAGAVRVRAVLLEPALRRPHQLRGPRGRMGPHRRRGEHRRPRLRRGVPQGRQDRGPCLDLPRWGEPGKPNWPWSATTKRASWGSWLRRPDGAAGRCATTPVSARDPARA